MGSVEDDEESQGPDLVAAVDELLNQPFDTALQNNEHLRRYINEHENSKELEDEFRESWHPEAPAELRTVLEEILDPRRAAAAAEELQKFNKQMAASIEPADSRAVFGLGDIGEEPAGRRSRL